MVGVPIEELPVSKDEYEEGAGKETTDVRPECHTASLHAKASEAADDLDEQPVSQHQVRGHGQRRDEESQRHKHMNVDARVEHNVGTHHAADRARSAHHRDE